jgi:nucleoside-diphosphate-sugar epimerase
VFSCERAHAELGWAPEHDLASGVARTVAWYRAHGLV